MTIKQQKATFSTSVVNFKENLKDLTTKLFWEQFMKRIESRKQTILI